MKYRPINSIHELGKSVLVTAELNKILSTFSKDGEVKAMERLFPSIYNNLVVKANLYAAEYSDVDAPEVGVMLESYEMIEKIFTEIFKTEKPTCHDQPLGCCGCCYINVDVTQIEAKLILEFAEDNDVEINWDKIKKLADSVENLGEEYVSKYANSIPYPDRRCPLLGDDNLCTIYEVRPLLCRTHHVASPVENCDTSLGSSITKDYHNIAIEMIKSCLLILYKMTPTSMSNLNITLMKLKST